MKYEYIALGPGEPFITCGLDHDVAYPSPEQLEVSPELQAALESWIDRFRQGGEGEHGPGSFSHNHLVDGWVLARRLAREVGPGPLVRWGSSPALDAPHP